MQRHFKALFALVKENKAMYITAMLSTVVTVIIGFLTPLVFSETIDVVLSDAPSSMPEFLKAPVRSLGGREFLRQNLWLIALTVVALNVLNGVFSYFKQRNTAVAGENVAKSLRERLYRQLSYLSFSYHVRAETGDLIQRCTSDVETVRRFLSVQLVEAFRALIMVAVAGVILFNRNAQITFYSLILVPAMFLGSFQFFRKITQSFRLSDESEGKMSNVLQENLTGVRVVRAFGMQQREVEKFDRASTDFRQKTFKLYRHLAVYWGSMDFLTMLQVMITLLVCVGQAIEGRITVGTLVVFTSYISMLLYPIRQLGRILSDAGKSMVALGRIQNVLDECAEAEEPEALRPPLDGDIVFDHVCFSYEEGNEVLRDLCFTIPAGTTVALLGNTGSGKSTVVHLLQRLIKPTSGRITIGGVDIQRIDRWYLRRHVGLMLQEPFLYGRTIRGNLAMAAPDAPESAVLEMSRVAHADGFIREFEKGYETLIGERGVTLSGGQRQRVAIARTLLKENNVLIFDDSLSAVDMQTDRAIREALREKRSGVTTIIISHRINTLCEAQRIFVLEDGRLSDEGTHEELISRDGLYQQIYAIQSALEDDLNRSREAVAREEEAACRDMKK
ncbi:MAG TPA: ABC transporter ATP-binding protein [Candidatus Limiplasma stercoravium]|nr:ABC transporter ATP-binding protein [Candidatus Limiplasma stercoravium]